MPNQPYLNEKEALESPLTVTVRNREKIFYQDSAKGVTSYNAKGKFDILPEHVNFISIITKQIIIYKPDNTTQEFKISTGVLKVNKNDVQIFLGILNQQPPPPTIPSLKK